MPTIDSSYGAPTANAYVDVSYASSYMAANVIDAGSWEGAERDKRERSLIAATRDIDTLHFRGTRYYAGQRLKLPLQLEGEAAFASRLSTLTGYENIRMERAVKEATCEQALYLLRLGGRQKHWELRSQGVISVSQNIGPIGEGYGYAGGSRVCHSAITLLGEWVGAPKVMRG